MSLDRAPVQILTIDHVLHAAALTDPTGSTWCGLDEATLPFDKVKDVTYGTATHPHPPVPPGGTICEKCQEVHDERYPNPATFNVHAPAADGQVASVLLQDINEASPCF